MRRAAVWLVLVGALPLLASPTRAGGLQSVEKEFRAAIEQVTPATVICAPWGVPPERAGSSSGVIISRDGFVLSDGDAGAYAQGEGRERRQALSDEIEVRVPHLDTGGFAAYRATVVRRVRAVDSTLLKIEDLPAGGFPGHLVPATSDHLDVGDFSFAMGNSFGMAGEAPPALTAGIVASLTYLPAGDAGGKYKAIYTSAAVNPGVNGGPLVDVEGRLVGTVSTWLQPSPGEPYQFLGKVVPMDRIRAAYGDLPDATTLFPPANVTRVRAKASAAFETLYRYVARRIGPAVVSLEAKRKQPMNTKSPGQRGLIDVQRYRGPVSGILIDGDGWIVTSLYNLTNTATLVFRGWQAPPEAELETGLRAIENVIVHLPQGGQADAKIVAHDGRLGIVLLKATLPGSAEGAASSAASPVPLVGAAADSYTAGRFLLALGNPFGAKRNPDPLVTAGILSKQHAADAPDAWRGQWQTDAGGTDANCGGAVANLQGHLLGMLHIWTPIRHGRNSGIAFVVPWHEILAVLPRLKDGRSLARGFLGVRWREGAEAATITEVTEGSPAAGAGLRPGDRIVSVGGRETPTIREVAGRLMVRWEGERVLLGILRGGEMFEVEVVLAARPAP